MWKEVAYLINKDIKLDFRQRYAVFATLLYIVSTTYISYLIFRSVNDRMTWVALYWIITIFAGLTSATRSFNSESSNRFWYYAQLAKPTSVVLAKMIYNVVQLSLVGVFTYLLFTLLLGNPIVDNVQMLVITILGAFGFASTLTLVSAIASKTNNNTTLMAILSIPLLLPLTVTLIAASNNAALGEPWENNFSLMAILFLLGALSSVLSFVLFPYMWRE